MISRIVSTRSIRASFFLAVVGLLGSLPRAIFPDIRFEVGHLVSLLVGLFLEVPRLFGPKLPVLRVVAGVGVDLPFVQLPDLGDDLVEKVSVVTDDDHADRLAAQVAFEPGGGGDIEVVRRLVQEHQVGAFQEQLRQHHPRLLAPRKRPR